MSSAAEDVFANMLVECQSSMKKGHSIGTTVSNIRSVQHADKRTVEHTDEEESRILSLRVWLYRANAGTSPPGSTHQIVSQCLFHSNIIVVDEHGAIYSFILSLLYVPATFVFILRFN